MKPEQDILKVIAAASNPVKIRTGRLRQNVELNNHPELMTIILHEGMIAIYRSKDHLLMRYSQGPMILGMNDLININENMYIKSLGDIRYEIIPMAQFNEIIDRENLWKEVAHILMYGIKRLVQAHQTTAGLTTYELIKNNLFNLMQESNEIRLNISASDYIREKTHLSRSRVMKILGELKIGGYIEIKRGTLMKVNKLPQEF